jgi:hypothetical protein
MSDPRFHLCEVETPEGRKHYLTVLPTEVVFRAGMIPESIVGVLRRPLAPGEPITREVFVRNSLFVKFMHEIVARFAPLEPEFQAEAKRLGTGWVYIIDNRTKTPNGSVPPEDIVGAFEVNNRKVVPDSYRPSPKYQILSKDGLFQLTPFLYAQMLRELHSRLESR